MNIPLYPESRAVEICDLPVFKKLFGDNPPRISEFTFANIYSWRKSYGFEISRINEQLLLSCVKSGEKSFFSPIGSGDAGKVIEEVITHAGSSFIRMPEESALFFSSDTRFSVELDRDNSDYVYNTADLVSLSGRRYDGKRNLIKKFKASYAYEYIVLDANNCREILNFEQAWCVIKDCDHVEGLNSERSAITEMADNFAEFELIAGAIRVEGTIRAVAVAQMLNQDTLVMHVLKADPGMTGLYQLMNQEFLSRQSAGAVYVNMEQDLGSEGLRRAKQSYHPVFMINKYTLRKK